MRRHSHTVLSPRMRFHSSLRPTDRASFFSWQPGTSDANLHATQSQRGLWATSSAYLLNLRFYDRLALVLVLFCDQHDCTPLAGLSCSSEGTVLLCLRMKEIVPVDLQVDWLIRLRKIQNLQNRCCECCLCSVLCLHFLCFSVFLFFSVGPCGGRLYEWVAVVNGPTESVYEGGNFFLKITFPETYPFDPPLVRVRQTGKLRD